MCKLFPFLIQNFHLLLIIFPICFLFFNKTATVANKEKSSFDDDITTERCVCKYKIMIDVIYLNVGGRHTHELHSHTCNVWRNYLIVSKGPKITWNNCTWPTDISKWTFLNIVNVQKCNKFAWPFLFSC